MQQGITACGIETSAKQDNHVNEMFDKSCNRALPLTVLKRVQYCTILFRPYFKNLVLQQGITACGIETRTNYKIINTLIMNPLQQGITACGIETN